jgi:Ca2+-binding RTX toxin-like protein
MQTVWPSGTRFSPGTTTLIGTSSDDEMTIEQSFTTLVAGPGDDVLHGTNDTSRIDKVYGGVGDDVVHWSKGFNIIHGGQPTLDYSADGTDTVDYTGVGEVVITLNKHAVPHRLPTFFAVSEQSRDWLFSIERLEWDPQSDHIRLGKGVELLEENLTLKLGMESSDGKGDVLDFAEVDAGLFFNASEDGNLLVTAALSEPEAGIWVEEADWVVGSSGDDIIYAGVGLHGIEGGEGADLIDAREVTPGTGSSPAGYDLEIDGGEGDDTIVIGEGSTLLHGGAGDDTFVLGTMGGLARGDEIVFADADSGDRLLIPYDLFNGSGGDYEGSVLFPVLGAIGTYDEMVTYGWTQYFDWRLEEHWLWEDDSTKGVIDFYGDVYYELVDGDLLVHLVQAEAVPTAIPIDDAGHTKNVVFTHWLTDTETILRIESYQEGDLGINFYDVGEGVGIDTGQGFTATHYPYWDSTVQTLTNNGQFLAPLDPRPAAAEQPDGPAGGPPPAVTIAGGGDDDVIAAAEASHVSAGGGTDTVTGSPGADVLDGGAGADTLAGGAGRDTYIVDDVGDVVLEQAGGGIDTVIASAGFALADHVEHLTLTGSASAGWGNGLANRIFGNDGANVLDGLGGGDTLYGGLGADLLQGGDGGDGYVYAAGDGDDTIIDTGSAGETDTLVLTGLAPGDVNVHRLAASPDDLVLTVAQGAASWSSASWLPPAPASTRWCSTTVPYGRATISISVRRRPRCSTTNRRRPSTISISSRSGPRPSSKQRTCSPTIAISTAARCRSSRWGRRLSARSHSSQTAGCV